MNDLHVELNRLQVVNTQPHRKKTVRKAIAHVHIAQNQMVKENLRKFYQGDKYKPKDLRPKQTRAMRRLLTEEEQMITLPKQQRKNCAFPKRNFALKE